MCDGVLKWISTQIGESKLNVVGESHVQVAINVLESNILEVATNVTMDLVYSNVFRTTASHMAIDVDSGIQSNIDKCNTGDYNPNYYE